MPLESRSLAHRHGLETLVQTPVRAKSLDSVMDAREVLDKHVTKYKAAGGPDMSEEEKVGVALRAMPPSIEHSVIRSLPCSPDYESLKDALEDKIAFVQDSFSCTAPRHRERYLPWSVPEARARLPSLLLVDLSSVLREMRELRD